MNIEDTTHSFVERTLRDVLTNVFFFGLFTFICIWLVSRYYLVSKIGFYIFVIVFVFITFSVIKTLISAMVCIFSHRQSSVIKNRYMIVGALRIVENVVTYLLLSLLCSKLYGMSLIRLFKHTFH
jgi:magnesium-transporting ATPase (P-type)